MEENDNQGNGDQEPILETKKSINIVGVGNRYQIKKLTNKDDINKIKLRKETQKWKVIGDVYERNYQLELLSFDDAYNYYFKFCNHQSQKFIVNKRYFEKFLTINIKDQIVYETFIKISWILQYEVK